MTPPAGGVQSAAAAAALGAALREMSHLCHKIAHRKRYIACESPPKPGRESSEANRGRKGGARERYEKSPPKRVGIMSGADFAPMWHPKLDSNQRPSA